jgi:hypothetical protein
MKAMALGAFPALGGRPLALRIDVDQCDDGIERELDTLYRRMARSGDCLYGMAAPGIAHPGFAFRHRMADGEHYVYALDCAHGRMAGYTVFNRLVEVDRRTDRHVRAPHAKFGVAYRRAGIATAIYRWWLDGGNCLLSGARQSSGAHALWMSLARHYRLIHANLHERRLYAVPPAQLARRRDELGTRMLLLGAGWNLERWCAATGMPLPEMPERLPGTE